MNARPAKVCDHFDERATNIFAQLQLAPGNPVSKICTLIAAELRRAHDAGYAEAKYGRPTLMELAAQRTPQMDAELHEYAVELGRAVKSRLERRLALLAPRDVRQRLYELRRTIRDFDTQSDHDVERTEGWANGSGAL